MNDVYLQDSSMSLLVRVCVCCVCVRAYSRNESVVMLVDDSFDLGSGFEVLRPCRGQNFGGVLELNFGDGVPETQGNTKPEPVKSQSIGMVVVWRGWDCQKTGTQCAVQG
jgi:hypothetical protein